MHIQFSAEEDLGPEGRIDCPVVPGGEQGGSHIVDQVHHLHLQARTRVRGAREGRTQDPHTHRSGKCKKSKKYRTDFG